MTPEQLQTIIDTINSGAWSIVGSLWALIFATTWKG
jgi:hypothetical protein